MKISVDGQGRVAPEGSAELILDRSDAIGVPPSGQLPPYEVAERLFKCKECNETFHARAGQITTHECAARS